MNFELKEVGAKKQVISKQAIFLGGCEVGEVEESSPGQSGVAAPPCHVAIHLDRLPGAASKKYSGVGLAQGHGESIEEAFSEALASNREAYENGLADLNLLESLLTGEKK